MTYCGSLPNLVSLIYEFKLDQDFRPFSRAPFPPIIMSGTGH